MIRRGRGRERNPIDSVPGMVLIGVWSSAKAVLAV